MPTVIPPMQVQQARENPLVASIKYANDAIKQSFTLMQNAKQLGIQEKEINYNKNLNLLTSLQNQYNSRANEIGPKAAWDEYEALFGSVYSALGMDESAFKRMAVAVRESPDSHGDIMVAIENAFKSGEVKDLSSVTGETITQAYSEWQRTSKEVSTPGKGVYTVSQTESKPGDIVSDLAAQIHGSYIAAFKGNTGVLDFKTLDDRTAHDKFLNMVQPTLMRAKEMVKNGTMTSAQYDKFISDVEGKMGFSVDVTEIEKAEMRNQANTLALAGSSLPIAGAIMIQSRTPIKKLPDYRTAEWAVETGIPEDVAEHVRESTDFWQKTEIAARDLAAVKQAETQLGIAKARGGPNAVKNAQDALNKAKEKLGVTGKMIASAQEAIRTPAEIKQTFTQEIIGTGPQAGADLNVFKAERSKMWEGQVLRNADGTTTKINRETAVAIANFESTLKPKTSTVEGGEWVTVNKPIVQTSVVPRGYEADAKKDMVFPGLDLDEADTGKAYRAHASLYEWWAKRQAGVEFGKGDQARMSSSTKAFLNSLPRATPQMSSDGITAYLTMMGGGNYQRGLETFSASLNTAAYQAVTGRMAEERAGEKRFRFSPDMAKLIPGIDLSGSFTADQAQVIAGFLQLAMAGGVAATFAQSQQGEMWAAAYKDASTRFGEASKMAYEQSKGDVGKYQQYLNAWRTAPENQAASELLQDSTKYLYPYADPDTGEFLGYPETSMKNFPLGGLLNALLGRQVTAPTSPQEWGNLFGNYGLPPKVEGAATGTGTIAVKPLEYSSQQAEAVGKRWTGGIGGDRGAVPQLPQSDVMKDK